MAKESAPIKEIDELDSRIINTLLENSRLSYRKISRKLGVSVATVMNRVNGLEESGIVRGYGAKMDYEKIGYDVNVLIDVRVQKGKLLEVEHKIAAHPNVVAVYDVTGPFDIAIVAKFKTRKEMDRFLKKLQTYDFVERTETKLILNIMKEESLKV